MIPAKKVLNSYASYSLDELRFLENIAAAMHERFDGHELKLELDRLKTELNRRQKELVSTDKISVIKVEQPCES